MNKQNLQYDDREERFSSVLDFKRAHLKFLEEQKTKWLGDKPSDKDKPSPLEETINEEVKSCMESINEIISSRFSNNLKKSHEITKYMRVYDSAVNVRVNSYMAGNTRRITFVISKLITKPNETLYLSGKMINAIKNIMKNNYRIEEQGIEIFKKANICLIKVDLIEP